MLLNVACYKLFNSSSNLKFYNLSNALVLTILTSTKFLGDMMKTQVAARSLTVKSVDVSIKRVVSQLSTSI